MNRKIATLISLAYENPEIRTATLKIVAAEEDSSSKGAPSGWQDFINSKYDGGSKKVPNPNRDGRERQVTFNTAMKDKKFQSRAMKEFAKWKESNGGGSSEKKPSGKSPEKALKGAVKSLESAAKAALIGSGAWAQGERPNLKLPTISSGMSPEDAGKALKQLEKASQQVEKMIKDAEKAIDDQPYQSSSDKKEKKDKMKSKLDKAKKTISSMESQLSSMQKSSSLFDQVVRLANSNKAVQEKVLPTLAKYRR